MIETKFNHYFCIICGFNSLSGFEIFYETFSIKYEFEIEKKCNFFLFNYSDMLMSLELQLPKGLPIRLYILVEDLINSIVEP